MTIFINTDGTGFYSQVIRPVRITHVDLCYAAGCFSAAQLLAYFDTATWDVSRDGFISTDQLFLAELRDMLEAHGLPSVDIDYSEHDSQGMDYVSFSVDSVFLACWLEMHQVCH